MSARALRSRMLSQQAEWTAQTHYRSLEKEVVGVVGRRLSARNMRLDRSDLEEAYCQAWHGVCEQIVRGAKIANLTGPHPRPSDLRPLRALRHSGSGQGEPQAGRGERAMIRRDAAEVVQPAAGSRAVQDQSRRVWRKAPEWPALQSSPTSPGRNPAPIR